jgi:Endomembrane protein 70
VGAVLTVVLLLALPHAPCVDAAGQFAAGDAVQLWANKLGPLNSPTESYAFYDKLPWCRTPTPTTRSLRLGEALSGDRIVLSPYVLSFAKDQYDEQLCEIALSAAEVEKFAAAIKKRYAYDLILDSDLPMKLFVGDLGSQLLTPLSPTEMLGFILYTHINFSISYNGDRIIEASASPGKPVALVSGLTATVRFSYSVTWQPTDFPYERRLEKYGDPQHNRYREIHWFGIINGLCSTLLLTALFSTILLRAVRRDVRKYTRAQGDDEADDDAGWKHVHGDVFRFPSGLIIFCPFLGTGVQLLVLSTVLLFLGALEIFHPLARGTLQSTVLLTYAFTAWVAGYTSGYIYKQLGGRAWVANALSTVIFFCGPAGAVFAVLHTIALIYGSTRALPVWTIAAITVMWALVTIPLTLIGAILGKNASRPLPCPCPATKIPREIPRSSFWRSPLFVTVACGLMPFCSIYLELHSMFSAIWGHRIFQVYEMLAITFGILNTVLVMITTSAVYFQLALEDYRWWWNSLLYGGSVGAWVFAYSMFYYFLQSPLEGFLQGSFYFGYVLLICYAFSLMGGTVGFLSSRWFVLWLYRQIKSD